MNRLEREAGEMIMKEREGQKMSIRTSPVVIGNLMILMIPFQKAYG